MRILNMTQRACYGDRRRNQKVMALPAGRHQRFRDDLLDWLEDTLYMGRDGP